MKALFSPSLMCMDFADIKNQAEILNSRCDSYHVDIMDGHFVPNLALSPDFVACFSRIAKKPLECHLMVTNPQDYVSQLKLSGADTISFQVETAQNQAFRLIKMIKDCGCKVGAVFSPSTPLSSAQYYLHLLDKITVMTVDPGFAGQPFVGEMLKKIEQAKLIREQNGYRYLIEVDGSCNSRTFGKLYKAGTDCFVVGTSGLFSLDSSLEKAWENMVGIFEKSICAEG